MADGWNPRSGGLRDNESESTNMGVTGKCNFEPLEWQLRNIQPNGYSGPAEQLGSTGDGIQPISSGEQQKLHQSNTVNNK